MIEDFTYILEKDECQLTLHRGCASELDYLSNRLSPAGVRRMDRQQGDRPAEAVDAYSRVWSQEGGCSVWNICGTLRCRNPQQLINEYVLVLAERYEIAELTIWNRLFLISIIWSLLRSSNYVSSFLNMI